MLSMTRAVLLLHRYLGIAISLLMAAWCLSGIVMMYVDFPSFGGKTRLATLSPLRFAACAQVEPGQEQIDDHAIDSFRFEQLVGHPVLRLSGQFGQQVVDLCSGSPVERFDADQSRQIVVEYASNTGSGLPSLIGQLDVDQWTVSGGYRRDRPLYQFGFADAAATQVYVSSRTGEIIQRTTARERFWNRCGAVIHWLYFTPLRERAQLWTQTVIWLSVAGVFLTIAGIYLGIARLQAGWSPGRISPFRGLNLWHHMFGLIFGLLTLAWIGSGLISMNPWGILQSDYAIPEEAQWRGTALTSSMALRIARVLQSAPPGAWAAGDGVLAVQISSAPLNGRLYLIAATATHRWRLDAQTLAPTPLVSEDVRRAAITALGVPSITLINSGDEFHYSHHEQGFEPAYRVIGTDAGRSRYYIDSVSGEILIKYDRAARRYRWWFNALHRWDFAPGIRRHPVWDIVVIGLLLGVTGTCVTGVALGFRRVRR